MSLVLIARLVLAAVFAVAGVAKLADRKGTRESLVAFGAPARVTAPLAIVLPLAELVVAGLLLPAGTAAYGAAGAIVLLAIFTGAIAISLARGRTPDCHCFGQLHSAPAGWTTVARNAALAVVALVALAGSISEQDVSAVAWMGRLEGSELLALAVAVAAAVVVSVAVVGLVSLMRSYGRVLVRLERVEAALAGAGIDIGDPELGPEVGLEPGSPAPTFILPSLRGETVTVEALTAAGPAVLLFTSPSCGPCTSLLPTAASWQHEHDGSLTVAFASDGTLEDVRAEAELYGLDLVMHDADRRLAEAFETNGTPSAVLIAPDGTIASWVASGGDAIERLVAHVLEGHQELPGLPVGAEAPTLELPSLDGADVSLDSLRGRDALLLFWNPDCGFCRSMHDDVLAWEASANGVTPRLVIVSSGDAESTRAEGFRSLVLLDEEYAAWSAYRASGTPMGVLVDANGRIGSHVAAGADDVLALAGRDVETPAGREGRPT